MYWQIQYKPTGNNPQDRLRQIVKQLLTNRGITDEAARQTFFHPSHPSTFTLSDIGISETEAEKAVSRILEALKLNQQIIVYGDYDADGICSTAIMWEKLNALEAQVMPYLPDRFNEGYGMKVAAVQQLQSQYPNLKLIVTVDQGIVAHEAIEYCNDQGIDVIVTDHHQPSESLPPAYAIIHTTKTSGSAVAWWFCEFLKGKLPKDASTTSLQANQGLELAVIGTVTDVMPLLGINRSLVAHGLSALRTSTRTGLKELLAVAGVKQDELDTYHIGFIIGPRLNAMGRLGHALDSLRIICTRDRGKAQSLAYALNHTNQERQDLTLTTFEHAYQIVKQSFTNEKIIIVGDSSYPEGIIGLVAGRLVEKFHRPAIVLSQGQDIAKASARSISAFNIIEAIRSQQDLLIGAGGHPMAAGFTISLEHLESFRSRLLAYAEGKLNPEDFEAPLTVESLVDFPDITWELFNYIDQFSPFGHANPEPVFATEEVKLLSFKVVGQKQQHLKLQLSQNKIIFNAIAFNYGHLASDLKINQEVKIAYSITSNTWNGQSSLELKIKDINPFSS